jgi:thiamine-phosphate pyrophosphorylase
MDKKYLRLIDANLNRCREGLRVVEDTARFVLEKDKLYKEVRALRHRLDTLTRHIYPELLQQRDSVADAGRVIKEGRRENIGGVLAANFRRAEESLRVLEEYGRLIAPEAGPEIKKIRFAVYTMEKEAMGDL